MSSYWERRLQQNRQRSLQAQADRYSAQVPSPVLEAQERRRGQVEAERVARAERERALARAGEARREEEARRAQAEARAAQARREREEAARVEAARRAEAEARVNRSLVERRGLVGEDESRAALRRQFEAQTDLFAGSGTGRDFRVEPRTPAEQQQTRDLAEFVLFGPERGSVAGGEAGRLERFVRDWGLSEQEFRLAGERAGEGRAGAAAGWAALGLAGAVPFFGDVAQGVGRAGRAASQAADVGRAEDLLRAARPFDAAEAGFEYGEQINRALRVEDVPDVMYHVAPRSARESIEQTGLAPQNVWNTGVGRWPGMTYADDAVRTADTLEPAVYRPDGVYMFSNIEDAREFARGDVPFDIYEVRTRDISDSGGQIIRDPESIGPTAATSNTFVTRIVPKSFVSRIDEAADVARATELQQSVGALRPVGELPVVRSLDELNSSERLQMGPLQLRIDAKLAFRGSGVSDDVIERTANEVFEQSPRPIYDERGQSYRLAAGMNNMNRLEQIEEIGRRLGITPNPGYAKVENLNQVVQRFDELEPATNVFMKDFESILDSGGLSTPAERASSSASLGWWTPEGRLSAVERPRFGVAEESGRTPIYGYLVGRRGTSPQSWERRSTPSAMGYNITSSEAGGAYGEIQLRFNDDVRDATSFHIGDSVRQGWGVGRPLSRVTESDLELAGIRHADEAYYIETQTWQSPKVEDIASISARDTLLPRIQAMLDERGLDIPLYDDGSDILVPPDIARKGTMSIYDYVESQVAAAARGAESAENAGRFGGEIQNAGQTAVKNILGDAENSRSVSQSVNSILDSAEPGLFNLESSTKTADNYYAPVVENSNILGDAEKFIDRLTGRRQIRTGTVLDDFRPTISESDAANVLRIAQEEADKFPTVAKTEAWEQSASNLWESQKAASEWPEGGYSPFENMLEWGQVPVSRIAEAMDAKATVTANILSEINYFNIYNRIFSEISPEVARAFAYSVGADYSYIPHVQKFLNNASTVINVPESALESIASSNQFYNQFTTMTSRGTLSPNFRVSEEYAKMDIPLSKGPDARPIYGYLAFPDLTAADLSRSVENTFGSGLDATWATNGLRILGDGTRGYGDFAFVLKPEYRDSSTFVFGDSLGGWDVPSPLSGASTSDIIGAGVNNIPHSPYGSGPMYVEAQIFASGDKVTDMVDYVVVETASQAREIERIFGGAIEARIMER